MRDYWNGNDQNLTISTAPLGHASLITVSGEIDMRTAPRLRTELRDVLAEPATGPVVVDLTAVTFLSSAGLAILADAHHEARRRGRPLALVVDHFTTAVIRPLQTVGLDGLVASYSVLGDASAPGS
jgi:anti-sigma B factor antagonist